MKSFLHIKIKGLWLWCAAAAVAVTIVITCCSINPFVVSQPDSATVGSTVPITVTFSYHNIYASDQEYMVFAMLVPKGWDGADNIKITYGGSQGTGNLVPMPSTVLEPKSNGLTWAAALKKKFGIGGNLVDDMEWVVFKSDKTVQLSNGMNITGTLNISVKVGADGNNTLCKLGYVMANSTNGLQDPDGFIDGDPGTQFEYYSEYISPCFQLTGGPGDLVDFCNPQLTSYDPPKSLDNDFFTITFDGTVTSTALDGADAVYLCATGYTNDGKAITVCDQSAKTKLTQTAAKSGKYKVTMWPRQFFGITDAQTLSNMTFFITDATGAKKVGYGNTSSPFTYTFKCK